MALPQNPTAVFMIRPTGFTPNPETATDNHFQTNAEPGDAEHAVAEFDTMVTALRAAGITVIAEDQHRNDTPDAVFPNNWFSTHHDGTVVLYPMAAPSRRRERRDDLIERLNTKFLTRQKIDLSGLEEQERFLEGTGAIVFDHLSNTALMARSKRADEDVLTALCEALGYTPLVFNAIDPQGRPIYHTNVMMAIGQHTALFGAETVPDEATRDQVISIIAAHGRSLINLSNAQIEAFAGNALEIDGEHGPVLVLSSAAHASLSDLQRDELSARVSLLPVTIPTIEKSGGSARCMMAGIHLPPA